MKNNTPLTKSEILEVVDKVRASVKTEVDCKAMSGVPTSEMILTISRLKEKAVFEVTHGSYKVTVRNAAKRHLSKSPVTLEFTGNAVEISISVVAGVESVDLKAFIEKVVEPLNQ